MTENEYISQFQHEADMARMERIVKRLWITLIIVIVLFVGSNAVWIVYENQFEDVVVTQEAEADSGNAVVNNGGDLIYGGES